MARILIVDDEVSILTVLRVLINNLGHEAVTCSDGGDALQIIRSDDTIDLVISDLRMSGVNGMDVTAAVKKQRPNTPVLVVSAYLTEENWREAKELGVCGGILKPFRADNVRKAVEAALSGEVASDIQT